jgi:putative SOS response-associated peptidase YedK
MCGRFGLTREASRELAYLLGVDDADLSFHRPRYNIAPTQEHFVMISEYERRKVLSARWGLVNRGARDNSRAAQCINVMAETVEVKPSYREAFRQRRCIVPADGFYEWVGAKQARTPVWFHPQAGGLLFFAGLYEAWQPKAGQPETTFTILTCEPNRVTRPIHNRMPVILADTKAQEDWINPREPNPRSLAIADSRAGRSVAGAASIKLGQQREERWPRTANTECDRRDSRFICSKKWRLEYMLTLASENLSQTILQRHFGRALRRRGEPVFEILDSYLVLNLRLLHLYNEERGRPSSVGVPFTLSENPPRLRHRLEKAFSVYVDAVLHSLGVPTTHFARTDRHERGP